MSAAIMAWAAGVWARLLPWLLAAGAVLAAVAAIYERGASAARHAEQARRAARIIKAQEIRLDVQAGISGRADGAAADELRDRWARD